MLTGFLSLCLLFVAAVASNVSEPVQVHVHHRMRILGDDAPFTPKGTILVAPTGPSFAPAASVRDQLNTWARASEKPNALYEVALQTDGSPNDWPRASTKLCYVTSAKDEVLTLHRTLAGDIFAIDYHLSSVPSNGACPSKSAPLFLASTDVLLKSPSPPIRPRLKTPPPMTPEGQPIQPVAEKSFIQKYWMYIVPALIILLVLPAGPEEGAQQ
ncbi:transmembrane protein [Ceratobasidium sp. AG-Ba]|nr:transmembrane protein [Ceratobasidium sp. AG-Ba]QRW02197.1 transmembrane protein [Ceratobasidium sp. AG-Ba]